MGFDTDKAAQGAPNGDVLIAFPYAIQFVTQATFDCKTQKGIDILSKDVHVFMPMIPLVPNAKAPRAQVRADLPKGKVFLSLCRLGSWSILIA